MKHFLTEAENAPATMKATRDRLEHVKRVHLSAMAWMASRFAPEAIDLVGERDVLALVQAAKNALDDLLDSCQREYNAANNLIVACKEIVALSAELQEMKIRLEATNELVSNMRTAPADGLVQ